VDYHSDNRTTGVKFTLFAERKQFLILSVPATD